MNKFQYYRWKVDENARLLTFVKNRVDFSTVDVRFAIEHSHCFVNGKLERFGSRRLKSSDLVEISLKQRPKFCFDKERVLFEDEHLLIYDKPPFIPSTGPFSLESLLKLKALHRLDRDTSGAMLFAKDEKTACEIERLFKERKVEKTYLGYVHGTFKETKGEVVGYLTKQHKRECECIMKVSPSGLYAKTVWKLIKNCGSFALIECFPMTGRTHQIRIHLSSIGHPLVKDPIYGTRADQNFPRLMLHAKSISLILPYSQKKLFIESVLPDEFKSL